MKVSKILGAMVGVVWSAFMVVGCLPQGSGTPFDGCESGSGNPCTCSNGLEGVLSCEEDVLYCVCAIEAGMDLGISPAPDMSVVGQDMMSSSQEMGNDLDDMTTPDMGEGTPDMTTVPMCGGAPCTCETAPLPAGWTSADVGDVDLPGSAGSLTGEWCIEASGRDIYGSEDGFHFAYADVQGDVDMVARLVEFTGVDAWSKVGLMIREDVGGSARHAATLATAQNGSMLFHREEAAGTTLQTMPTDGEAFSPIWLRLTRRGDVFEASTSPDGSAWTTLGTSMEVPGFAANAKVGLALSSHDNTATVTAKFTDVDVQEQ